MKPLSRATFLTGPSLQLAQPLDYAQSAPLGFLFAQKAMVNFGSSELWLRAIPFAASLAALVIFAALVRRVLNEFGQAVAVTAFALGSPFIYFGGASQAVCDRCGGGAAAHVAAVAWNREVTLDRLLARCAESSPSPAARCRMRRRCSSPLTASSLDGPIGVEQAPLSRPQFVAVQLLWIAGMAISAWLSLGSINAPDLAYIARDLLRVVRADPSARPAKRCGWCAGWSTRLACRSLRRRDWMADCATRCPGCTPSSPSSASVRLWRRQRQVALVLLLPILAASPLRRCACIHWAGGTRSICYRC